MDNKKDVICSGCINITSCIKINIPASNCNEFSS